MSTGPLTLVIFGATGDLTARKLAPALYRLDRKKRLPEGLRVVGVARSPLTDDAFRERLRGDLQEHARKDFDAAAWSAFAPRLAYVAADAARPGGLAPLAERLRQLEAGRPAGRLFYLAVSPDLYAGIAGQIAAAGLHRADGGWARLVIEKPFGRDLASARALNRALLSHFDEGQIFRIDHYLGKETVQNILAFRFANTLFEPVWNHNFIDHVQITVAETVTVEGRGGYYDRSGVLRDMVQNHLMQLLTFVAMEAPAKFAATPVRNEKVKVLEAVSVPTKEDACGRVVTGQYAGYRSEKGVPPDSRTATFACLELGVDNWRWRGVPFFLRSGKALASRQSEVVVQFRCPPHMMFPLPPGTELQCNRLSLCIQPDEGIHLSFQAKAPDGEAMELRPADLEFHYRSAFGAKELPDGYERLLLDALNGDATLFMRSDEIERAWEIVDPLIAAVEAPDGSLPTEYAVGGEGPVCADKFLAATGRTWLSLCHH
jgi:glucose-6-phosphate 1-dehydrogenase